MRRRGFITLEGGEGAGKTTQLGMLMGHLHSLGLESVATFEPGGTRLGESLRRQILNAAAKPTALAELFLFCADRAQHVEQIIKPALSCGKVVVCDRFTDSTMAYQGYARGLDLDVIASLTAVASAGVTPDLTLLLDVPVEIGLARVGSRAREEVARPLAYAGAAGKESGRKEAIPPPSGNAFPRGAAELEAPAAGGRMPGLDGIEAEAVEFHCRVREGFLRIAVANPGRVVVIDGTQEKQAIFAQIKAAVAEILER